MSINIQYGNASFPEVVNNYNTATGTLSSITLIAYNSQALNVNDLVNVIITSGSFATTTGTPIPASTLDGMARIISKVAYTGKDEKEYIRLEFNPAKPMPGLVVPLEASLSIRGTMTKVNEAPAPLFYNNTTAYYPAPAPAFYNSNIAFSPAVAPAPAGRVIIPTIILNIVDTMSEQSQMALINVLNTYDQTTINSIGFLVSLIFDISDSSGNKFGDAFAYTDVSGVKIYLHQEFRNTYVNLLGWVIFNHIFLFVVGIRFMQDILNIISGGTASLNNIPNEILTYYNLCNQINNISNQINNTNKINKIIQFYREIFNRKNEFNNRFYDPSSAIPVLANILMRILYPPAAGAPAPTIVYFPPMPQREIFQAPAPAPYYINSGPPIPEITCDPSVILYNEDILTNPSSSREQVDNASTYLTQCGINIEPSNSRPPATNTNSRPPATNTNSRPPATNTNSRAPAPAQGVNIYRRIVDFANDTEGSGDMLLSMFNNRSIYNQDDIDRIKGRLDLIYQITDMTGDKISDAFDYNEVDGVKTYLRPEFRNTYKNFLTNVIMNYLFFFIRGERFIEELTNGNITIDSLEDQAQKDLYRLASQIHDNGIRIFNFFREVFNRKDELLSYYDDTDVSNPIFTNILMRILYPPAAGAPAPTVLSLTRAPAPYNPPEPTPEPAPQPAASRLSKIRSDLEYLTSLGLTANSDNETMKKTLRNFKNITGSDYVFPSASSPQGPTILRQELDKDLKYLFGLGLTQDSGNETMNDRLAKWKQLTGEDYVYNPSGGKYRRKRLARKSVKRKTKGKSKTRKQ